MTDKTGELAAADFAGVLGAQERQAALWKCSQPAENAYRLCLKQVSIVLGIPISHAR